MIFNYHSSCSHLICTYHKLVWFKKQETKKSILQNLSRYHFKQQTTTAYSWTHFNGTLRMKNELKKARISIWIIMNYCWFLQGGVDVRHLSSPVHSRYCKTTLIFSLKKENLILHSVDGEEVKMTKRWVTSHLRSLLPRSSLHFSNTPFRSSRACRFLPTQPTLQVFQSE